MRESEVRFYIDADLLGLARLLGALRNDITFPADPGATIHKRLRPPCPIQRTDALDTEWLPVVGERGWLVITRDHNIRENIAERRAVRAAGVRMVALAGDDARTKWGQLEVVMKRWRQIEALLIEPGPFIYRASYSRMVPLSLSE